MFGIKSTTSLISSSKSIANTFTATLANLRSVNQEIEMQDRILEGEQAKIQKERDELAEVHATNSRMAQKIEDFLA